MLDFLLFEILCPHQFDNLTFAKMISFLLRIYFIFVWMLARLLIFTMLLLNCCTLWFLIFIGSRVKAFDFNAKIIWLFVNTLLKNVFLWWLNLFWFCFFLCLLKRRRQWLSLPIYALILSCKTLFLLELCLLNNEINTHFSTSLSLHS